jgi:hypothetical protein
MMTQLVKITSRYYAVLVNARVNFFTSKDDDNLAHSFHT